MNSRKNSSGMTLLELLVGTAVIMVLIAAAGLQIRGLVQRAKISAAKTTINFIALSLKTIKDDTGLYPMELSHMKEIIPPEGFPQRNWYGPYGKGLSLIDPWQNPYFYELTEGTIFGPDAYWKKTPPKTDTYFFNAFPGRGTIVITNLGITAGRVWLNGVEVVVPNDFKHGYGITKPVTLLESNTLEIRLTSNPTAQILLKITSPFSKNTTFSLGSYGRDKNPGGTKWNADIIYRDY